LSSPYGAEIGGDFVAYGKGLAGMPLESAQRMLGESGFGRDAHAMRSFDGLQEGLASLA